MDVWIYKDILSSVIQWFNFLELQQIAECATEIAYQVACFFS